MALGVGLLVGVIYSLLRAASSPLFGSTGLRPASRLRLARTAGAPSGVQPEEEQWSDTTTSSSSAPAPLRGPLPDAGLQAGRWPSSTRARSGGPAPCGVAARRRSW